MIMVYCLLPLLCMLMVNGIVGQYYSQINPNSRFYNGNYNRNYIGSYNGNINPNLLRYPEAAVRAGELLVEVNEPQGQTPCRNKEANKEHKESLWWTLPIPPMELEGPPEKPPQIKQPEPVQQVESKPQISSGGETGAMQQKHGQIAPTSTAKAQVAPVAATPQAVVQVATTTSSKHETSSAAPKQDRTKVAQMQKQQQQQQAAAAAAAQPQAAQNAAPVPTQLVVSNKDNTNQQQMITNKSVATMRAPGRAMAPVIPHGSSKQKVMLNMNMLDPAGYQYPQEALPQGGYMNNPYFNSPYHREPQLVANRGYRSDMMDSMAELADSMYKNFDSNDAEIGGGGVVGGNLPYGTNQARSNMFQYDTNFSPVQSEDADAWDDERNKRNPLDNYKQKVAIS